MTELPEIHHCIARLTGHVHSIGLAQLARRFRYSLRRHSARVALTKTRLRRAALNFICGPHLALDRAQYRRHAFQALVVAVAV